MQFNFKEEMAKRTNEELIKILTIDRENYLPEAIAVAEEEFKIRNLSEENVSFIAGDLKAKKEIDIKKANEPLEVGIKILALLLPMIITFIVSGFYKAQGYDKKTNQLATWTFIGIGLYIVIILITTLK